MTIQSTRASVIIRRTYNRPIGDRFETWDETIDRVIDHQQWLWERAKGDELNIDELSELIELRGLYLNRVGLCSGRTLWLGGTDIAKRREASQFNCSFLEIRNVYDIVDSFWLLLQGCGVGFKAVCGSLFGFAHKIEEIEIIRSNKKNEKGREENKESYHTEDGIVWYLSIGDSAEAWAKSIGKLMVMKQKVDKIVIDFRQIRSAGTRLKGYGWISSGDDALVKCFEGIIGILNNKCDQVLDEIDILDIMNHLGTCLSSRRSAEICLMDFENPKWREFATIKKNHWIDNPQRSQSNNTILFNKKPTQDEIREIFDLMIESGGSEPGFGNAEALKRDAPYYKGNNPCFEIILADKSFCCLSELNLSAVNGYSKENLERTMFLLARANYRQTCVDLRDGILQTGWHETNEFLRLTGMGLTGIVQWEHYDKPEMFRFLKETALKGVHSIADELNLTRSKMTCTIKPSGTLSKCMGTLKNEVCEGIHKPLGKYIFNNVRFSIHDPIVEKLKKSNYKVFPDPYGEDSMLVCLPVKYDNVEFDIIDGKEVNNEPALVQLERYKMIMENYVEHNCSTTISYDVSEVDGILDWLYENWDVFKGVSWMFRNDASKTAEDLGYPYLPQEVKTKEEYNEYVAQLLPFDLDEDEGTEKVFEITHEKCAGGSCPLR